MAFPKPKEFNQTYCNSSDFIPLRNGKAEYYLEKDNTIYKKGKGQNYKPIRKLNKKPKIKVINREFNHRKVIF